MTVSQSHDLLVFGGPYSNLEALKAVRAKANEMGIPPQNCICTGDLVAYCADPKATLDEMRDWGCQAIQGNCEEALGSGAQECGCGFEEGTTCDALSKQWFGYVQERLSKEDLTWMGTLPQQLYFKWAGQSFRVVHGGVSEISQFIFASDTETINDQLEQAEADVVLSGHSGIAFAHIHKNRLWLNAGVIGMPANDGNSDTWFLVLKQMENGLVAYDFRQMPYPHRKAARKMRERGLPEGYALAMESGLWPSVDVLPDMEQSMSGKRLKLPYGYFRAFSSTKRLRMRP